MLEVSNQSVKKYKLYWKPWPQHVAAVTCSLRGRWKRWQTLANCLPSDSVKCMFWKMVVMMLSCYFYFEGEHRPFLVCIVLFQVSLLLGSNWRRVANNLVSPMPTTSKRGNLLATQAFTQGFLTEAKCRCINRATEKNCWSIYSDGLGHYVWYLLYHTGRGTLTVLVKELSVWSSFYLCNKGKQSGQWL